LRQFRIIVEEPIGLESLLPDRSSGEALGAQLVRRLRGAIESGVFPPAARLFPSRELAKRLGVARNTVTSALDQLVAEGYLETRVGAGTYVTRRRTRPRERAAPAARSLPARAQSLDALQSELEALGTSSGPLRVGAADLTEFPLRTWQRLNRKNFAAFGTPLDYAQSSGLRALREAIARHIAQFRGVATDADQITIVEGTQGALALVAAALTEPGDRIAVEDPCYQLGRTVFAARGLALCPVYVDGDGLRTGSLPAHAALAYVTPAHQFPLGGALSLSRRTELLQWAARTGAYVIEDDYDSEFDAQPLPALQSLDRDERVIYVGTFSKTLAQGLRLGYVVAPPHLAETLRVARGLAGFGASAHLQATAADFISQGYFNRHIRRMAAIYERRRRIVVETLSNALPERFTIGPSRTGLHLAIRGPAGFDDVRAANAMQNGQRVLPLSRLCLERTDCTGFVIGFNAGDDAAVANAAAALAASL
jgi:GntR family transcriptional regulator/MocR family aminotransferase